MLFFSKFCRFFQHFQTLARPYAEGAATYAAYKAGLEDGKISKTERVLLFNCATGLKYPMPPSNNSIDRHQPIDYAKIARGESNVQKD